SRPSDRAGNHSALHRGRRLAKLESSAVSPLFAREEFVSMSFSSGSLVAALFAVCTALFWGVYGPLLQRGHHFMGTEGRLRPFICVGFAYLLVAIIGPIVVMYATGIDRGEGVLHGWTTRGILWSTMAGAVGALGAF